VTVASGGWSPSAHLPLIHHSLGLHCQQSGPPASARQLQELLALLREARHTDFRDARGPMGFTQRQAVGKFTRAEAAALIDRG